MTQTAYDYIVIGAGSSGCVLAGQLARAQAGRILLLEAGDAAERHPEGLSADGFKYAFSNDAMMWHRMSVAQKDCGDRPVYIGTGRGMGGSGAVNGMVYTRGDRRLIPAILDKAKQGKMTRAVGNRDKLSDFTYITNLTDAVVAAEDRLQPGSPVSGQAYFITNGEPMAFFDFIEQFIVQMGYPPITGKVPFWLAYSVASIAEAIDTLKGGTLNAENGLTRFSVRYMVTHHYFNISKAKRDLGWTPKVSIAEGIRLTAAGLGA